MEAFVDELLADDDASTQASDAAAGKAPALQSQEQLQHPAHHGNYGHESHTQSRQVISHTFL